MRITCYYGNGIDMGYIYLKPGADEFDEYDLSKNEINKHVNPDQIIIPFIKDANVASYLDQMTIAANTFVEDYEIHYDTEYGNDLDEEGYITGIELTLNHDRFIDLVNNQAFKVIQTEWRNKEFHVITFDHSENVFKSENVIYKLTDKEDAFVIVKLELPKNLGFQYTEDIALFKAFISGRNDIYPLDYLLQPDFLLLKNTSLKFINDDLVCEVDAIQFWDSIPEEHRERIINNFYCGNCSDNVKIVECRIYNEANVLMMRGKCKKCGQRVERRIERQFGRHH